MKLPGGAGGVKAGPRLLQLIIYPFSAPCAILSLPFAGVHQVESTHRPVLAGRFQEMAEQTGPALLIVEKGVEEASVIPLDQKSHLIGNLSGADISLSNPYVSRQHAQIQFE